MEAIIILAVYIRVSLFAFEVLTLFLFDEFLDPQRVYILKLLLISVLDWIPFVLEKVD
jgi:hypothetical protein